MKSLVLFSPLLFPFTAHALSTQNLNNIVRTDGWLISAFAGYPKGSDYSGGAQECTGPLVGAFQGIGNSACEALPDDTQAADCFVLQTFDEKKCTLVVYREDEREACIPSDLDVRIPFSMPGTVRATSFSTRTFKVECPD